MLDLTGLDQSACQELRSEAQHVHGGLLTSTQEQFIRSPAKCSTTEGCGIQRKRNVKQKVLFFVFKRNRKSKSVYEKMINWGGGGKIGCFCVVLWLVLSRGLTGYRREMEVCDISVLRSERNSTGGTTQWKKRKKHSWKMSLLLCVNLQSSVLHTSLCPLVLSKTVCPM